MADAPWWRRLWDWVARHLGRGPRPVVAVTALAMGARARVRGRVIPRDTFTSPLGGEEVVYARTTIERWQATHSVGAFNEGLWLVDHRDESVAEFYVDDGSGRVMIAAGRIEMSRPAEHTRSFALGGHRRGFEVVIQPGDVIEVEGVVGEVADVFAEDVDTRGSALRPLLHGRGGRPLAVTMVESGPATPRAGRRTP